jgi:hypothetical protein
MQTLDKLDRQILLIANRAHYSRFIMITLRKHTSVQDCKSSFVLDRVKSATAVPPLVTRFAGLPAASKARLHDVAALQHF